MDIVGTLAKQKVGLTPTAKVPAALQPDYYRHLFSVPMWVALGCLLLLFALYPGGRSTGVRRVDAIA